MVKGVSHIAVAVPNVDEAAKFYVEKLGLAVSGKEVVAGAKVRVGFIPVGETRIELVQPDSPNSPVTKFLEKRGPGLQHISFEVTSLDAALAELAARGIEPIAPPSIGAGGLRICFLHPRQTEGVLLELVEYPA